MEECSLPKARPILCNESPAFQRHHMSLFCAAESPNRFPWVINTTFGEKTYIRWCCNDRLSSQHLPDNCPWLPEVWLWDVDPFEACGRVPGPVVFRVRFSRLQFCNPHPFNTFPNHSNYTLNKH